MAKRAGSSGGGKRRRRGAAKAGRSEAAARERGSTPRTFDADESLEAADLETPLAEPGEPIADLLGAQRELEEQLHFGPEWHEELAPAGPVRTYALPSEEVDRGNILGTAVARKIVHDRQSGIGSYTGDLCVRVYVRSKVESNRIRESAVPENIGGFPTDVVECGEFVQFSRFPVPSGAFYSGRERPARGGSGIGPYVLGGGGAGTLGGVCLADGAFCILSNNHVLALNDRLQPPNPIIQPGNSSISRGSYPRDAVGALERVIPVNLGGQSLVDAALALTNKLAASGEHKSYVMNPDPVRPFEGMRVRKDGWRTGATSGVIESVYGNPRVLVETPAGRFSTYYRGQILIRGIDSLFSYLGDSGSLIVSDIPQAKHRPVGLLFAGDHLQNITWANPIGDVISALKIERFVNTRNYH